MVYLPRAPKSPLRWYRPPRSTITIGATIGSELSQLPPPPTKCATAYTVGSNVPADLQQPTEDFPLRTVVPRHTQCFTRSSADANKPARRVYRTVKLTKHGTIRYLRYGFLLMWFSTCNSVHRTHHFWGVENWDIRLKNAVTLKTGLEVRQSHWKCHHSLERIWLPTDSSLTMALSRVVSEIPNVEKYRDLEIPVKGQSRSLKVVPYDRLGMVAY